MDKVIIITLNYNQNDYTLKCVESLLKNTYKDFLILLVDNGSTEANFNNLKTSIPNDDRILLKRIENNRGYVGGINTALTESLKYNPNYIMILNNDTIIDSKAITYFIETCKNYDNKAIVSGKVYHYDQPNVLQEIGGVFTNRNKFKIKRKGVNENDEGQYDSIQERDLLDDVFWLFHVNLYRFIGGYSPYFWFSAEQADYALRAQKNGYKLIYDYRAKLWHKGSVSFGGRDRNPKIAYWHTQSTLILKYLYLTKPEFIRFYLKILFSILSSYLNEIKNLLMNKGYSFKYPNSKLSALKYFHRWLFIKNENVGKNPFYKN